MKLKIKKGKNPAQNSAGKYLPIFLLAAFMLVSCSHSAPVTEKAPYADTAELKILAQSPAHTVLSQQSVFRFGESTMQDSLTVNGIIVPDERRTNVIAAKFGGRIEKLYVRLPFQFVRKGEKLFDIYSPELNTAISEYIFLFQKDSLSALAVQARQKLYLLGLTSLQVSSFEKAGLPPSSVSFFSPYEGYVINVPTGNSVTTGSAISAPGGMNGMSQPMNENSADKTSASLLVREGSYIVAGQTLFTLNDARDVFALLSIDGNFQSTVKEGMPLDITSEFSPGKIMNGKVILVEPEFENGQHFLAVKVQLNNNDHSLKFNSLVQATLKMSAENKNAVPSSCVLDLGERKIVWLKSGEINHVFVFIPRVVVTSNDDGGYTTILSGLKPGDEIAIQAGLLTDREGIIQTQLP